MNNNKIDDLLDRLRYELLMAENTPTLEQLERELHAPLIHQNES